jgi:MFS family permease
MAGPIINHDVAKAILEDRYRGAEQQRLVAQSLRRRREERRRSGGEQSVPGQMADQTPRPPGRRLTAVLFAGAALGSTAHIASGTISILAVVEVTGNAALAGVPVAAGVLGTALGSVLLPRLFARPGLRPGLISGYVTAVAGNLLCLVALAGPSLPLLLIGMALSGVGSAANHLTRYAAAESHPMERKAKVVGTIVWAGTLGSVAGPLLLQPSAGVAAELGRSQLAGGFLVGAVFMAAVAVLYLATLPATQRPRPAPHPVVAKREPLRRVMTRPTVRVAMTALVGSQIVMVIIMAATPLHISHHGPALDEVGLVMMAHTFGMYALAPLIGKIADRRGATLTLITGMAVLGISAFASATLSSTSTTLLAVVLFALGLGWSLAFVSGSSILSREAGDLRSGVHGRGDAFIWLSGGAASISSGAIYNVSDFHTVALVGLLIVTAVTLSIAWGWRPSAPAMADAK